jgi:tripartite-type tricarboxylate transporter receptor subunit TctC
MSDTLTRRHVIACATLWPLATRAAAEWPTRPLRIIVPGGPGGVIDIRARWIAQRIAAPLGQAVVVENRPGAGGNVGTEAGARSEPDGHTLTLIHQGTMTVNPHLYARLGYDALADFTPVARLGIGPLLLAVHPSLPATSPAELIDLAKAKPGQLNFGSPGIGTPPHLAAELFKRATQIQVVHVPYKGGGQAAADLIAGHVQFAFDSLNVLMPHVQAGRLRALAMTGARRVAALPAVPTMAEAGWPQCQFVGWAGLAVPAATPTTVVERLYQVVHAVLDSSEARDWFGAIGAEPGDVPPATFARDIRAEHAKWGGVIREAGIRLE